MKFSILAASLSLMLIAPSAFAEAPEATQETVETLEIVVPVDSSDTLPLAPNPELATSTAYALGSSDPEFLRFPVPVPDDGTGGGGSGGGSGGGGGNNYVCEATITCLGSNTIPNYTLTCQGEYSCATHCGVVVCDGIGTLCFFGGANC